MVFFVLFLTERISCSDWDFVCLLHSYSCKTYNFNYNMIIYYFASFKPTSDTLKQTFFVCLLQKNSPPKWCFLCDIFFKNWYCICFWKSGFAILDVFNIQKLFLKLLSLMMSSGWHLLELILFGVILPNSGMVTTHKREHWRPSFLIMDYFTSLLEAV